MTKDYLLSKFDSNGLAKSIQDYWHQRGYTKVRVHVETDTLASGEQRHYVRSNIVFRVPQL